MKTKNVRIKLKDIRKGKVVYIGHPKFGIQKVIILSKPDNEFFINCLEENEFCEGGYLERNRSLIDMGVVNPYNYRRTFHNETQARRYVNKFKYDQKFISYWNRHMEECQRWNRQWRKI